MLHVHDVLHRALIDRNSKASMHRIHILIILEVSSLVSLVVSGIFEIINCI